jgi:RNA polymerase sigma-70 factor (ECF subfamily)
MKPLAELLADGDQDAFQSLYDLCSQRLFRFLVSKTGSCDLAADALQETFLRAVRFRERLREVNSLESWMFTIARREANRILTRSNRTRHSGLADAGELQQPVMQDQRDMDDREELETALAGLTTAEREILELHVYGGLTFREVAEVTETPPGTIATRYRSAVAKLRGRLHVASVSASKSVKETKQ